VRVVRRFLRNAIARVGIACDLLGFFARRDRGLLPLVAVVLGAGLVVIVAESPAMYLLLAAFL
jgi:hypothetical protein